jgi:inhibitor of cysteine peptidase
VVQKEIRKKTQVYGTIAILSAIVLVALIYAFGSGPVIFPVGETPAVSAMKTFSSYEELRDYLATNTQGSYYGYGGGPLDAKFFAERAPNLAPVPEPVPAQASSSGQTNSYSTTNIQVAGVDEADTVKNDGKYIYTISTEYDYSTISISTAYGYPTILPTIRNVIYIVKADPQDPKVIAKITFDNNTYPAGIFLSEDSSRLAVLASQYHIANDAMVFSYQSDVNTFIYVYDISDKAYPVLARNFTISGSYFNSRLIGNYVYAVVSQPAYAFDNNGTITNVTLPKVYDASKVAKVSDVAPSSVYYADTIPSYFTFTTFIGLNILDDAQEPTNMTIMMGGTSAMYVSMNNIYVTYPTWSEQGQYTSIYRVRVNGSALAFEAKGSVAGYVLNQYSMDEHNGYFRVATTWQMNNVYVLNMNLSLVGKLENLAEGESIYSVRFMGNKGYVVTFRQTDPFFVIDLNNPTDPKVVGELKIPGYSSYLHPYDENHVIGLGKENNTVKLSLFDVTNVNAPTETAKYIVNGEPADSQALQDPKAFLFDKQKELLVIPMSITQYSYIDITEEERARGEVSLQQSFWQGAYVFNLNLNNGFVLRGNVTHIEDNSEQKPPPYYQINRALYIGNTLYTVSNERVQLNSLENLALIAEVDLS